MTSELVPYEQRYPDLTPLMERYVVEYVANGGKGEKAAIAAGYSQASARTMSSRLLGDARVARALMEESALALGAMVPRALGTIARLSERAKSEYVQLEASKDVLTRAGMNAPKRHVVSGALNVTFDLS